ncbi:hypothetical protein [Beijerinckia sp. L45]|uniref:hypothetical protein n=1 Tax=Beijerinckia sp. L45 TaxID=1641855 RepID=UPI00131DE7C2|nr:hypothetical protein [Beijerinckia sp. L45]
MRWMAWNTVGCFLWLAGLAYAKGMSLAGDLAGATDGHQLGMGLAFGVVGLGLLMWVNLVDTA